MVTIRAFLLAAASLGLAGCGGMSMPTLPSMPSIPMLSSNGEKICAGAGLNVEIGFPSAGRHACVMTPEGNVVVSVDHEPTLVEGINPSPWFAFKVNADDARAATFTLDYTDYKHRYAPWVSTNGKDWAPLAPDRVTLNDRKSRATLRIDLPKGTIWVAGQPLSPSTDNIDWTRRTLAGAGFDEKKYGISLQGTSLVGFVGGGGLEALVIMTRQHPPETSGQEAYRGFLERLMTRKDDTAARFRARTRIIIAPMPNPDGVDGGYWRLNRGGMDLNRDWTNQTQPETRTLAAWIKEQAGDRRVMSMMDFHSTDKTVIYAPPLDSPSSSIGFLPALKSAFDAKLAKPPEWSYAHNPKGGTSKGWALEVLKSPGLTVELWDQIPAADARALGATAADAVIDYFTR